MGSRLCAAFVIGAAALGCSDGEECTAYYAYGLSVNVVDGSGNAVCDVTVDVRDGSYFEQKELAPLDCSFTGAGERAGTYDVSALRDGMVLASERVKVGANECHVETESVTLTVE